MGCHMHVLSQPSSSCFADPPDCTILCSSISNSTHVVNKDQAINGVGVSQLACVVIHEEYDGEPKHQPVMKDVPFVRTPSVFPRHIW